MEQGRVLEAFAVEAGRLTDVVAALPEGDWDRPTDCRPWRVRELFAHVTMAMGRLPGMLAAPPPDRAEISALEYYRPDERFAADANAARVATAQERAAERSGPALVRDFAETWRETHRLCRNEPGGRVVRTRHGDAMLLSDFMITRVVELALHGLDLAAALDREPWLTAQAGDVTEELLFGPDGTPGVRPLGWDQVTFLRKTCGRAPMTDAERDQVAAAGVRPLTLG